MSVGFGFSVGDFIAATELVGTVIDALRSSGEAGTQYRELVSQLLSLETALIQVKNLAFEESQYTEVIALRQAAAQCQRTIDAFWEKVKRYQPSVGGSGERSSMRDRWMKIKWAVCKKEDVARFKADLVGHTESIQLLLTAVQMRKSTLQDSRQVEAQKSLASLVKDGFLDCVQRLSEITGRGKQLLKLTTDVLQTNIKIFRVVLDIQQFIARLPAQVELEQPIQLLDALGKRSPFHLNFVRSVEALIAVLEVNFEKHGNGKQKIRSGEFVLQDAATKRDIDLTADWETCFVPGQHVEMSMIVSKGRDPKNVWVADLNCPRCRFTTGTYSSQVTCKSCGLSYHTTFLLWDSVHETVTHSHRLPLQPTLIYGPREGFKSDEIVQDETSSFQRVRVQINYNLNDYRKELKAHIGKKEPIAISVEKIGGVEASEELPGPSQKLGPSVRSIDMQGWWRCCRCLVSQEKCEWTPDSCCCGHDRCEWCCSDL